MPWILRLVVERLMIEEQVAASLIDRAPPAIVPASPREYVSKYIQTHNRSIKGELDEACW
jgi:hypothetical protein